MRCSSAVCCFRCEWQWTVSGTSWILKGQFVSSRNSERTRMSPPWAASPKSPTTYLMLSVGQRSSTSAPQRKWPTCWVKSSQDWRSTSRRSPALRSSPGWEEAYSHTLHAATTSRDTFCSLITVWRKIHRPLNISQETDTRCLTVRKVRKTFGFIKLYIGDDGGAAVFRCAMVTDSN